jgi:hypothetical protein
MQTMQERLLTGIHCLEAATTLLRRVRAAHPTAGTLEAADLQWWWRTPRSTYDLPQLFWFDRSGRQDAAIVATDWGDGIAPDPSLVPNATLDRVAYVIERGLAHAGELGFGAVDIVIDRADHATRETFVRHGFVDEHAEQLEVPFAWYDLAHVLDVLSRFPWLAGDARLHDMLGVLRGKADERGRFTLESVWTAWKDGEFGHKKAPSRWLSLMAWRILGRVGGAPPGGGGPSLRA